MKLKSEMTIGEAERLYEHDRRLELNPAFQRDSVWSVRERLLLIDSILKGYPLPAVFLCARRDGRKIKYDVIDGKQRIESILLFMGCIKGHAHTSFGGKVKDDACELGYREYNWEDMSVADRKKIRNYKLTIIQVDGDPEKVEKVFVRINSTGKPLSEGEILKAKYLKTRLFELIRAFADERLVQKRLERMGVINASKKCRFANVLLLAEIIVSQIKGGLLDKKRALDEMLNEKANRLTERDIKPHITTVRKAIEWAERIWESDGHKGLKFNESRFKKTSDFYSLIVLLANYIEDKFITDDKEGNRFAKQELMKLDNELRRYRIKIQSGESVKAVTGDFGEYRKSVWANADCIEHRRIRQEILGSLLKKCFGRKDRKRGFTRDERLYMKAKEIAKNGELICYLCGEPIEDCKNFCCKSYTLDHIKAHKRGGRSVLRNARPAHCSCNARKGAKINVKRDHIVWFNANGADAKGIYNYFSEKILVKKGSWTSLSRASHETVKRRKELIREGVLREFAKGYKFVKDYKCSPSFAACVLTGMKAYNGQWGWRLRDGTPIKELYKD